MEKSKKIKLELFKVCALLVVAFSMITGARDVAHTKDNATAFVASAYEGEYTYYINDSALLNNGQFQRVNIEFSAYNIDFNYIQLENDGGDLKLYYYSLSGLTVKVYDDVLFNGWSNNAYRQLKVYNLNYESNYLFTLGFYQSDTTQYYTLNGWYTFKTSIQATYTFDISFTCLGKYYNRVYASEGNLYYVNILNNSVDTSTLVRTNNGWIKQEYRVINIINSVVNRSTYQYLTTFGDFVYTNLGSTSTLGDLFLSVADIPIYTLAGIMSFELFGTELFIAFGSLIMLLLILKVVKLFI